MVSCQWCPISEDSGMSQIMPNGELKPLSKTKDCEACALHPTKKTNLDIYLQKLAARERG